ILLYQKELLELVKIQSDTGIPHGAEKDHVQNYRRHVLAFMKNLKSLESVASQYPSCNPENIKECLTMRDVLRSAMSALRDEGDWLECHTPKQHWPFPVYEEILYRV
ncbi:MAG: hypothetical protein PWP06_1030, partial [Candidatus Marinimicrobia bacterium]|nr:hypothetical protein [Candidatus Neomarinimicrobiota bacterium]